MKATEPLDALRQYVERYPTQQDAAAALEIHPSYLSALLKGRQGFSESILDKLGLKRVVVKAS